MTSSTVKVKEEEVKKSIRDNPYRYFFIKLWKSKLAVFGVVVIILIVLMAIFAPLIANQDPTKINIKDRLLPPVWEEKGTIDHLLGTDSLGRDVFSRLVYGSRVSLIVGISAVFIAGTIGTVLGLISGYFGGIVDDIIMRITDIQLAFPFILLAIAILAILGPGLRNIILVLGISGWVSYGRVVRGQVMSYKEKEFVEAAKALGLPTTRIIFRHILPNVVAPIIVIASFSVASTIISEASLSFLGLGVEPSIPTWGAMLSDGREYITKAWWLATFPGLAIVLTVMGINLFGDWLRDYLDPKIKD